MRKKLSAVAVLVALTALAAVLAPAAVSGGSDRDHHRYKVIELTTTVAQEGDIDVAPLGEFNVGDAFTFSDDVWKDGTKIGDRGGSCTVVRIEGTAAIVHCTATFRLPHGQLTAQGLITFDEAQTGPVSFTVAITGGTGAFRTAHGEIEILEGADDAAPDQVTIRLIR